MQLPLLKQQMNHCSKEIDVSRKSQYFDPKKLKKASILLCVLLFIGECEQLTERGECAGGSKMAAGSNLSAASSERVVQQGTNLK